MVPGDFLHPAVLILLNSPITASHLSSKLTSGTSYTDVTIDTTFLSLSPGAMEAQSQEIEVAEANIHHRTRRRPAISKPSATPTLIPPVEKNQNTTILSSEGPTIRCLRVALGETPVKLRELEAGWRERRKILSGTSRMMEPAQFHVTRAMSQKSLSKTYPKSDDSGKASTGHILQPRYGIAIGRDPQPAFAPPSPPPTPPPVQQRNKPNAPFQSGSQTRSPALPSKDKRCPSPILASPLPPTHQPVRLTSRSADTIHIHPPTSSIAITISLRDKSRIIHIARDGHTIDLVPHHQAGSDSPVATRRLSLSKWDKWSDSDRKDWDLIEEIVEGYKRHTPRVKLYLPLGHLVLTCSTPPDVYLHFDHVLEHNPKTKLELVAKVRIRLSRIAGEVTVDTSTSLPNEKLRTKRTIQLHTPLDAIPDLSLSATARSLKRIMEQMEGWSEGEREGLRRIFGMKDEWGLYG